ncbi:MAG: four helix bundle protein [Candidatus Marinimicrobia bacterium]|nr:four helix bundle protein [Candidatus Neomarinimicrobiota bacterium]
MDIWKDSRKFVCMIYEVSKDFPSYELYGLGNQMRRSAVSVMANISEGSSRISKKDFAHFLQFAYSSLMEVLSHCYHHFDLGYINDEKIKEIKPHIYMISNKLNALYRSQVNNV